MEMRTLGSTGLQVSPLCLGAMMFGAWGNPNHDEGIAVIHRALDAGLNFIDTADVYARGESEEIVGKALKGRRDTVVLATKVHGAMHDTDPNMKGNSRRWIIEEVEHSLRRLQTDWIDLYQIHRWDPETDHDETLGALTDLQRAGKIRYFGSSTFPPSQIIEAQWVAEKRGHVALRLRAAAVLDPRARRRDRGAADLPALRHGRHSLEPARRRLALRQVPEGQRRQEPPRRPDPGPLRPLAPGQPGEARGGRAARRSSASRRGSA